MIWYDRLLNNKLFSWPQNTLYVKGCVLLTQIVSSLIVHPLPWKAICIFLFAFCSELHCSCGKNTNRSRPTCLPLLKAARSHSAAAWSMALHFSVWAIFLEAPLWRCSIKHKRNPSWGGGRVVGWLICWTFPQDTGIYFPVCWPWFRCFTKPNQTVTISQC